ncbi:hypothetical protein [Wolbachia endosymbiont (group A) of Agelastica alni]|uniref:hypothetical protein n=1 Tax=Wolbachia endosymbiont (group A) of Agelastica alni TaxID=3066130 RepID=UPI003340F83A
MNKTKSFDIPKQLIWKAYKQVSKNRGAAGVDEVSITKFEENLKDNLYKLWNRMSSGSYFPESVKAVAIPKDTGGQRTLCVPMVRMDCTQVQSIFGIYYYHSSISSMEWATFSNIIDKELQEPGYI